MSSISTEITEPLNSMLFNFSSASFMISSVGNSKAPVPSKSLLLTLEKVVSRLFSRARSLSSCQEQPSGKFFRVILNLLTGILENMTSKGWLAKVLPLTSSIALEADSASSNSTKAKPLRILTSFMAPKGPKISFSSDSCTSRGNGLTNSLVLDNSPSCWWKVGTPCGGWL